MDLEEYKQNFRDSLKESRQLEETTFSMELFTFDEADRSEFERKADFHSDKWAIAQDGGAILMAHNCDMRPENKGYKCLSIYDSTGILLNNIPLESEENIKGLYITPEECIVVIFQNAEIHTYNLRGDQLGLYEFNPKKEPDEISDEPSKPYTSISSFAFWSSGFFIVTSAKKVFICDDLAQLKIRQFSTYNGGAPLIGCTAIPPDPDMQTGPILWGWSTAGEVALIQENLSESHEFDYPIENITFSPSKQFALLRAGTHYFFTNRSLSQVLIHLNFEDVSPRYILWCGNDTGLLISNKTIAMIGNSDSVMHWEMVSPVAAITEPDGARIFAKDGVYLLRAFTNAPTQFGLWNLKSPPVKLFNCMLDIKYLAVQEPINDFSLDYLQEALDGLNEAALFFTQYKQRLPLFKAISRLQSIIPVPKDDGSEESDKLLALRNFDQYADNLSMIRVCERLFHAPYNIPITYSQFNHLTPSVLLKRLCNRSLHFEAFRIANFLGIDAEFIAAHWSNCLIRSNLPPNDIKNSLLAMDQPIDLVDLATTAFDIESEDIAITLLDANTAKSRGVPLLLKREKWEEALSFAVSSNDMSLILYAFDEVKKQEKDDELDKIFEAFPIAREIWVKVLKGDDKIEFLKKMNREDLEMFKYYLTYNEGEEDLRAAIKKNKDSFMLDTLTLFKNIEPLRKYLRNKKLGIEEPPPPPKESIFSGIIDKIKGVKEDFDKKKKEEENKNENDKKKGKKGDSDDSEDEKPKKKKFFGKKKKDNSDEDESSEDEKPKKGKKGKKGKKDDSNEDESSEDEKPKKGKKGKKGKKDDSDEDESEDEKPKKGKKGKKNDSDEEKSEEEKKEGEEEKKEGEEEKKEGEEGKKEGEEEKKEGEEEKKEGEEEKKDEPKPEEKPQEPDPNFVPIETVQPEQKEEQKEDTPPPKPIPPKDEFDLMTPLEIFEHIVLYNDPSKILEAQKILGMTVEEALWKRLFTALKFNNMEVIKLLIKDKEAKPELKLEFVDYCKELKNQRAIDYLRGLDPDAEAEKKRKRYKK